MFISVNETAYFPFHIHDYYCISLITNGTEQLQTHTGTFYALAGTISVTQANEVHRNSSVDDMMYSYQTIYINPDILKYYNNGKEVIGFERIITDGELMKYFHVMANKKNSCLRIAERFIQRLLTHTRVIERPTTPSFDRLDELIISVGNERLGLDQMSSYFNMSKFHFIRQFKKTTGLNPQAYVMLQRLHNAKKMLSGGECISSAAFLNGFFDATHLNTAFKRYFGISTTMLKNSNIIHPDPEV